MNVIKNYTSTILLLLGILIGGVCGMIFGEAPKTGMLEVILMPDKRHTEDDLAPLLQFLQKGKPKMPKHIGMIGQDQKLHFSLLSSERGDGDPPSA